MFTLLLTLSLAVAQDDLESRHRELAEVAMRAERAGEPEAAVRACTEAITLFPTGPRTPRCRERIAFLEARRDADGGFGAWTSLEGIRAGYRTEDPDARRSAVVGLLTREGISATSRAEAALWLASDSLDRRRDAAEALAVTGPVHAAREGLEPALRTRVVMLHAAALARLGRAAEALDVEAEVHVVAAHPRPTPVEAELWSQQVGRMAQVAWGVVGLFAVVGTPLAVRGLRAPTLPGGLLPLLALLLPTWLLVHQRDDTADDAFPAMALGFVAIHVVTALARGPATGLLRALLAALSAGATIAVSFLALAAAGSLGWVGL